MESRILSGPGVHSGVPCRVEIVRRENDGGGVRFLLPGHPDPLPAMALSRLSRSARRATVLGEGEAALGTPEHLLAALLFFADLPLDIRCEGGEVPILDGSALPFREALAGLAPERAAHPSWREYPCATAWEQSWEGGYVRVRPAKRFAATYILRRRCCTGEVRVESAEQAWHGALPARTWITLREWREGTAAGLLKGAGQDNGLLLAEDRAEHDGFEVAGVTGRGPYPLLNKPGWRMPDEPVRHKLLDLVGDLALLELALPRLEIEICNGGHGIHHLILDRILER